MKPGKDDRSGFIPKFSPNNGLLNAATLVKAEVLDDPCGSSRSPKRNPPVNGLGLSPVNKLDNEDVLLVASRGGKAGGGRGTLRREVEAAGTSGGAGQGSG